MIHHLRAAGVSALIDARGTRVPTLVHWGPDLGPLDAPALAVLADAVVPAIGPSSIDMPLRLSLLPTLAEGWSGRPGFTGFRPGAALRDPALRLEAITLASASALHFTLTDAGSAVAVATEIEFTPQGILRLRHTLMNTGDTRFELTSLDATLPIPDRAAEILDFSGIWTHERRPQRTPLNQGVWSREARHGRPGHDDAFLMAAGTPGFGFRSGEVWATHVAWSGDKRQWAESSALGAATLGGGEFLAPGEVGLAPGADYTSPWTVAVYSASGLDGLSDRLHPWIRSWSSITRERPVILNTWEAVYFDQDLATLSHLVAAAAEVGVERFVLDDGWFTGRTDDRRALGDWFVDAVKWPHGLGPLITAVHDAGMEFGLWVEPEMVSLDSELARAHPDWVIGADDALTWRFQRVLDLGNPEAFAHIFGRIDALLREYPIAYLKWDHNRDLLGGSAHRQTSALYRLIDALRAAHPGVEIESCASGGARIDLGILERVDRVWTSDTNDPLERQQIQRYTGILVPPEYLGGHLGAALSHTTWRSSSLSFRLATALFGSAGIEWNVAAATPAERATIAAWTALYRRLRGLLHTGSVVRQDSSDPALALHGVVSPDRRSAVFAQVALTAPRAAVPAPLRFPGLDPELNYRVSPVQATADASGVPRAIQDAPPAWLAAGGVTLSGRVLAEAGLPGPLLAPEQAQLFSLEAV